MLTCPQPVFCRIIGPSEPGRHPRNGGQLSYPAETHGDDLTDGVGKTDLTAVFGCIFLVMVVRIVGRRPANRWGQALSASPLHPGWPHSHINSVVPFAASQRALQKL
jgi:hypothetical protein